MWKPSDSNISIGKDNSINISIPIDECGVALKSLNLETCDAIIKKLIRGQSEKKTDGTSLSNWHHGDNYPQKYDILDGEPHLDEWWDLRNDDEKNDTEIIRMIEKKLLHKFFAMNNVKPCKKMYAISEIEDSLKDSLDAYILYEITREKHYIDNSSKVDFEIDKFCESNELLFHKMKQISENIFEICEKKYGNRPRVGMINKELAEYMNK